MPVCSIQFPNEFAGLPMLRAGPECHAPLYTRDLRGIANLALALALIFLAASVSVAKDLPGKLELKTHGFPHRAVRSPRSLRAAGQTSRRLSPGTNRHPALRASY